MTVIKNGVGNGDLAKVDSDNRLWVDSRSSEVEGSEALRGKAFIIHARCKMGAVASGGLLYIKNTSATENIIITRMYFDAHILTPADGLIITQLKSPTPDVVLTGENITTTGVLNKKYDSGIPLGATVWAGGTTTKLGFSALGTEYHSFVMASKFSTQRDMKGTNVVTFNQILGIGFETFTGNATLNEVISLSINCVAVPVS